MDARAIDLDRLGIEIDRELAGLDDRLAVPLRTADDGVDARHQFVAMERLGDVIVGAEAEAAHLRIHLADARQDQHRRLPARDAELLERSEEHTSDLQSLMIISYAVFCLKNKTQDNV